MRRRRNQPSLVDLARGPGRLCEAFEIDRSLDHWNLARGSRIWLETPGETPYANSRVVSSVRIGVTSAHDERLRFYFWDCPFVSGTGKLNRSGRSIAGAERDDVNTGEGGGR